MKYFFAVLLYFSATYSMDESDIVFSQELLKHTEHYNNLLKQTNNKDDLLRDLSEKEERKFIESAMNITRLEHEISKNNETHTIIGAFIAQIIRDHNAGVPYTKPFYKDNLQHIDPKGNISHLSSSYSIGGENITVVIKGALSQNEPCAEPINIAYKKHYSQEHESLFVNTHLICKTVSSLVDYKKRTIQLNFHLEYAPGYKEDCLNAMIRNKRAFELHANLLYRLSQMQMPGKEKKPLYALIKETNEKN
jgi:hypothetical protein